MDTGNKEKEDKTKKTKRLPKKVLDQIQNEEFTKEYLKAGGIQHIICSATLTIDKTGRVTPRGQQIDKKRKQQQKLKLKGQKQVETTELTTLEALCKLLKFRSKTPKVIDLTSEERMPDTLFEQAVKCNKEEKDLFLHYYL